MPIKSIDALLIVVRPIFRLIDAITSIPFQRHTPKAWVHHLCLLDELNELRLAGSVMNLTSTVPPDFYSATCHSCLESALIVFTTVFPLGLSPKLAFGAPRPCCFPLRIGVFDLPAPTSLQLVSSFTLSSLLEVVGTILLVVCN
jgi:hypothetical protein